MNFLSKTNPRCERLDNLLRQVTLVVMVAGILTACNSGGGTEESGDIVCPEELGMTLTLGSADYCGLDLNNFRNIRVLSNLEERNWVTERTIDDQRNYTDGQFNRVDTNVCRVSVIDQFERPFRA